MRVFVLLAAAVSALAADPKLTPEMQAVTQHISAASLRGHLSFLASDLLEGRKTTSRGLDLAAEYIAAQFRRAGLEAAGDDGYFQTAVLTQVEPSSEGIELSLEHGSVSLTAAKGAVLPRSPHAAELSEVPVFKASDSLHAEDVKGRAVVLAR